MDIDVNRYLIISASDESTKDATTSVMYYNEYQDKYSEPLQWAGGDEYQSGSIILSDLLAVKKSDYANAYGKRCPFTKCTVEEVPVKGNTKIGTVSSANRDAYPDNGKSGSNWYVYKGSDSIDPLSVAYSTDRPERGEAVTVLVEPCKMEGSAPQWAVSSLPVSSSWDDVAYGEGRFLEIGRAHV